MFSGRRSARSGARVPLGAPFAAPASVKTGVEVSSGKIIRPRVSNLTQCCRFFQRKVRAVRGAAACPHAQMQNVAAETAASTPLRRNRLSAGSHSERTQRPAGLPAYLQSDSAPLRGEAFLLRAARRVLARNLPVKFGSRGKC